ncbi:MULTISPECIES: hypothetical protein [Saccharopolyspora]|uniref:Uncharacterized protein n=1 Tax=Saccharopolyspora elongata TaxID=2530387 RepID=A0A4R4YCX1_9PSEU|nr:hypothetical protein [Saccharopolyspora elongata]TDD41032.1 hypothetical protein E1288_33885 [Saccharopolyspora elongata]
MGSPEQQHGVGELHADSAAIKRGIDRLMTQINTMNTTEQQVNELNNVLRSAYVSGAGQQLQAGINTWLDKYRQVKTKFDWVIDGLMQSDTTFLDVDANNSDTATQFSQSLYNELSAKSAG